MGRWTWKVKGRLISSLELSSTGIKYMWLMAGSPYINLHNNNDNFIYTLDSEEKFVQ